MKALSPPISPSLLRRVGRLALTACAVAAAILFGCAVPESIKERPSEGDEGDYYPSFVNPQPTNLGTIRIPAACRSYTFKVLLTALPPADDERYAQAEVRWYFDYATNTTPLLTAPPAQINTLPPISPHDIMVAADSTAREPGYRMHTLEVEISDRGFDRDSTLPPRWRMPVSGSHTDTVTWSIYFEGDPDATLANPEEQCL